jgi:LPXTG-motif cell wall-anchored protein
LGNVTFIPFLTASNPLAMPDLAAIAGSSPAPTVEPPNNSTKPEQPSQPSNNGTTPESPNKPSDNATTPEPPSEPNNQDANSVVVYQIVIAVLAAMVGVLLAVIGLVFRKRKKQSQSATPTKPVNS